ncbi:MAG: polyphosphate polymerase domain-containing protein [Lachnospiraceae bacterium]|nr:polyphosphate polymerase domain-containing protein [Lachnospiraceae bacterium]
MDIRNNTKYRNEIKYICSEQQLQLIEHRISKLCKKDTHAGADGTYTVRSLYFDDYHNSCMKENESGVNAREKFRIRIYNGNTERITLECKQKLNGKNHKESCALTKEQCQEILQGVCKMPENPSPLFRKFYLQYHTRVLRPKVIVQYDRTPFVYKAGNVRITCDRNISGTENVKLFLEKEIPVRPVMEKDSHVLEVKYDEFLPDFVKSTVQIKNLNQTAFSKYYMCRKFKLS